MILVTGGAGYVGSHFVRAYLHQNSENRVVVIDNLSLGHLQSIPESDRLTFFKCDIGDRQTVEKILSDFAIDGVLHFAAKAYVHESQADPFGYFPGSGGSVKRWNLCRRH